LTWIIIIIIIVSGVVCGDPAKVTVHMKFHVDNSNQLRSARKLLMYCTADLGRKSTSSTPRCDFGKREIEIIANKLPV
jgi:hypothetical protein